MLSEDKKLGNRRLTFVSASDQKFEPQDGSYQGEALNVPTAF